MITYTQAIILGLLQGVTELFPISSLGHSIIIPGLLGWNLNMNGAEMLEFLVATHFATALVLFLFYWKDWMRIIGAFFRSLGNWNLVSSSDGAGGDAYAKLAWLLIIGTIPAGAIGLAFNKKLEALFTDPRSAALFLGLNGILLFAAEMTRRRALKARPQAQQQQQEETLAGGDARIARLGWWQSFKVGLMQVLSLIPGISRTGSTFAGSLWTGLSHEDSLRFSFLLATPVIGGAALLELPKLAHGGHALIAVSCTGAIAAAIAAYCSVKFLVRWFKTRTLLPFAAYCLAMGILGLIILR